MSEREKFEVGRNRCDCHPETCCCYDWAIYTVNGDTHSTHFSKEIAKEIASALNSAAHSAAEIADLRRRQLEDARKDADRYAYLRNENRRRALALNGPEAGVWCDCEDADENLVLLTGADLDAAIDAAMKDTK